MSARNYDFGASVESNQKTAIESWFNIFDAQQVDNTVTVGSKEEGRVKPLLQVAETPSHHRTALTEVNARAVAFRLEQYKVGDSNDPATLTLLDQNAFGCSDLLYSRSSNLCRWTQPLLYSRLQVRFDSL